MTLLDIKNHLYSHFLIKSRFSLKDDLNELKLGGEYDEAKGKMAPYKATLLRAALQDMEKAGLVLVVDQESGLYVLTQPLLSYNQQVTISPQTANLVADAFNLFARVAGNNEYTANKFAITETEVNTVANVAMILHQRLGEMSEEMDGLMEHLAEIGGFEGEDGPPFEENDPSLN